jgi:hypothetical protein
LIQKGLRLLRVRKEFLTGAAQSEKAFPSEAHFLSKAFRKLSFLLLKSFGFVHRPFLLLSHEQTFSREESSVNVPLAEPHGAFEEASTREGERKGFFFNRANR